MWVPTDITNMTLIKIKIKLLNTDFIVNESSKIQTFNCGYNEIFEVRICEPNFV